MNEAFNPARMARLVLGMLTISTLAAILAGCGGGGSGTGESIEAADGGAAATATAVDVPVPNMQPLTLDGWKTQPLVTTAAEMDTAAASEAVGRAGAAPGDVRRVALSAVRAAADAVVAAPVDIFVSTIGNDNWSGSLAAPNGNGSDGPVRTLPTAQARARATLAAMVQSGTRYPLRVRIQPGTYVLTSTLTFDPRDSGTVGAPVSYEAVTPGTVMISGAAPLTLLSQGSGNGPMLFAAPSEGGNAWAGGGQLFVNGRRAALARSPNVGAYYFIEKALPLATEPSGQQGRTAFKASPDALFTVAQLSAPDRGRAIVNVMHAWTASQHRLAATAPSGGVQLAPAANWTFLDAGTSQRYWIENVASALDAPGEFLWDASGVRYIPQAAEVGTAVNAAMPVLDKLISISGNLNTGNWVNSLQFRGLTFAHTRQLTPAGGLADYQAAADVGAAAEVDGAVFVTFDNCKFTGTAGYGVWFRRAAYYGSVVNSFFDDMGAGGIKVGQTSPWSGDLMQTGNITAVGNVIGNTGKTHPGAVGIWVGQGFDNKIVNNLIYNTTYSGISVGWNWTFDTITSGRNTIANNLLVNIGLGELSDMGGIYLVGVQPQTVVQGNVIREVRGYPAYGAGAWGIYGDSGTSQVRFTNNIVLGADSGTVQLTLSRSNTFLYNLFGWGDRTEINVGQADPLTALSFTNSMLIPKVEKPFTGSATAPYVAYVTNEVSSTFVGKPVDLAMCSTGCANSVSTVNATTDPRGIELVSPTAFMANRMGNVAANVGPIWLAYASSIVTVATQRPPVVVAPPITFEVDIANAPIGTQPSGLWYSAPGNIAATGVVTNAQAPNGRCLRYTDSASNINGYDPHTYGPMNHASGTTTGEFDLLIDANTYFTHQWRDNAVPVKTGPSLEVKGTGIYVAGALVAPVTVGQWMKFKVTAPLAGSGSTWTLQITDGNGIVTTRSGLAFVSSAWVSLNWWGFISNARVATSFCLASVKATNVK